MLLFIENVPLVQFFIGHVCFESVTEIAGLTNCYKLNSCHMVSKRDNVTCNQLARRGVGFRIGFPQGHYVLSAHDAWFEVLNQLRHKVKECHSLTVAASQLIVHPDVFCLYSQGTAWAMQRYVVKIRYFFTTSGPMYMASKAIYSTG